MIGAGSPSMRPRNFLHRLVSPAALRARGDPPSSRGREDGLMSRILVVDDDPIVARTLVDLLALHEQPGREGGLGRGRPSPAGSRRVRPGDAEALRMPGIDGDPRPARAHPRTLRRFAAGADAYGRAGCAGVLRQAYEVRARTTSCKAGRHHRAHPQGARVPAASSRCTTRLVRHREEAQARARDLALLHGIGRDWSLIAEPRRRSTAWSRSGWPELIGSRVCRMALGATRPARDACGRPLPAHGLFATRTRAALRLQRRGLTTWRRLGPRSRARPYAANEPAQSDLRAAAREAVARMPDAQSVVLALMISEGDADRGCWSPRTSRTASRRGGRAAAVAASPGPVATFIRSRQIFDRERRQRAPPGARGRAWWASW